MPSHDEHPNTSPNSPDCATTRWSWVIWRMKAESTSDDPRHGHVQAFSEPGFTRRPKSRYDPWAEDSFVHVIGIDCARRHFVVECQARLGLLRRAPGRLRRYGRLRKAHNMACAPAAIRHTVTDVHIISEMPDARIQAVQPCCHIIQYRCTSSVIFILIFCCISLGRLFIILSTRCGVEDNYENRTPSLC